MKGQKGKLIGLAVALCFCVAGCSDDDGGCTDLCSTEGASQCNGTVVESCSVAQDGCLDWIASTDCADIGQTCDDTSGVATCVDSCTDNCPAAGDTQCDNTVIETCTMGGNGCLDWVAGTNCADNGELCDDTGGNATCVAQCTDNCPAADDTQCDGTVIDTCTLGGNGCLDWLGGTDCSSTGDICVDTTGDATCVAPCTNNCPAADDTQCNVTVIETCTMGGNGCLDWVGGTDCSSTGDLCEDSSGDATCVPPAALDILLLGDDVTDASGVGWDTYRVALTAAGFSWTELNLDNDSFPDATTLAGYNVLIWFDESTLLPGDAECQIVADWLVSGNKNLFTTSVDFLWDVENGTAGGGENNLYLLFESEYLGDYAGTGIPTLDGVAADPISGDFVAPNGLLLSQTSDSNGDYVDETAANQATMGMFYAAGGTGSGHAGLTYYTDTTTAYKTVWLGVNFHNGLTDQNQRNVLMANILAFFTN